LYALPSDHASGSNIKPYADASIGTTADDVECVELQARYGVRVAAQNSFTSAILFNRPYLESIVFDEEHPQCSIGASSYGSIRVEFHTLNLALVATQCHQANTGKSVPYTQRPIHASRYNSFGTASNGGNHAVVSNHFSTPFPILYRPHLTTRQPIGINRECISEMAIER
jgi:hypothetical protein